MADIATLNGVAIADIAALNGVLKGSVDTVNGITRTPVLTGYTADQIPTMTSNTAPSGTASASSILSGTYAAFKAMDGVTAGDQGWASSSVAAWLQYEFTATKQIERYTMQMSTLGSSQFPTAWTFEGYNGSTWDVLDTQSSISWTADEKKTFTFTNATSYTKYRINITANNGHSSQDYIKEIEMMEGVYS